MLPIGSIDVSSLVGNPERLPALGGGAGTSGTSGADLSSLTDQLGGASSAGALAGAGTAGATDASVAAKFAGSQAPSFSSLLENAVGEVNAKMEAADAAKGALLSGETNNVHQSMIAVQEANVSFSLMVEVRNKLVDSYQELMRMQV